MGELNPVSEIGRFELRKGVKENPDGTREACIALEITAKDGSSFFIPLNRTQADRLGQTLLDWSRFEADGIE